MKNKFNNDSQNIKKSNKKLYYGHRERLREYIINGSDNINKDKLFEYFICLLIPVRDNRILAKTILEKFNGSFTALFNKDVNYLKNSLKLTNSVIAGILMFKKMMTIYNNEELSKEIRFDARTKLYTYFEREIGYRDTESILVLFLSSAQKIIERKLFSHKNTTWASFNMSEIVSIALNDNAKYIVLSHNHPSGDVRPSVNDKSVTAKFEETLKNLNKIEFIDHIIVSGNKYFSFYEHHLVKNSFGR